MSKTGANSPLGETLHTDGNAAMQDGVMDDWAGGGDEDDDTGDDDEDEAGAEDSGPTPAQSSTLSCKQRVKSEPSNRPPPKMALRPLQ